MSVKTMVENIYELLEDAHIDAEKHDNGNGAAGTRVRKAMQQLKFPQIKRAKATSVSCSHVLCLNPLHKLMPAVERGVGFPPSPSPR